VKVREEHLIHAQNQAELQARDATLAAIKQQGVNGLPGVDLNKCCVVMAWLTKNGVCQA
jgi:hypothetical protein